MTHEAHQQGEAPPGLIGQMLALLRLLIETFAQAFAEERQRLRALRSAPAPDNWQAHWPALRELEIKIHGLTLSGIEQLRAKGAVDLLTLTCIEDPTFVPTEPLTFEDMRARYEAVVAFMADPIPLMRQAAERAASPLRLDAPHRSTSPAFGGGGKSPVLVRRSDFLLRRRRGRWIARTCAQDGGGSRARAPPQLIPISARDNSPASPARTHPRAYAAISAAPSRRNDMSARRAA